VLRPVVARRRGAGTGRVVDDRVRDRQRRTGVGDDLGLGVQDVLGRGHETGTGDDHLRGADEDTGEGVRAERVDDDHDARDRDDEERGERRLVL